MEVGKFTSKLQDPIFKAQSLQFFISSIRDPYNLYHCGTCVDGAFRECTDAKPWIPQPVIKKRTRTSPKHDPDLWNAIVQFLFTRRSKKQMDRLFNQLLNCKCQMDQHSGNIQVYHEPKDESSDASKLRQYNLSSISNPPNEGARPTMAWCLFLSNLFHSLLVPLEGSSLRSTAKGEADSWPINSTDMFPFGADAFVQSMLQWYRFIPDPVIIRLMGAVLQGSRELVIPSIIKHKFTATIIEATKQLNDLIIVHYLTNPYPESLMVYTLQKFPWQTSDLIYYLGVCTFNVSRKDHKVALFQDCETKAMQVCSMQIYMYQALLNYFPFPLLVVNTKGLAMLGQELFRFFGMDLPSRPPLMVHPFVQQLDAKLVPSPPIHSTPRDAVFKVLTSFRVDTCCSAQGCLKSLHLVGKDFQRCGQCNIVSYCGRECQKKAWKDEEYPHKCICLILRDMLEKAGGSALLFEASRGKEKGKADPIIMAKISANWRKAQLDDNDLTFVSNWADAVRMSRDCPRLEEKEPSPGFSNCDTLFASLSTTKDGLKPVYMDRHVEA